MDVDKTSSRIRYGNVGYGLNAIGQRILLKYHPKLRKHYQWIGGFDPGVETRKVMEKTASKNNATVTNSFEDLLELPGLDAIIINSPPQFHAEQAIAALESGINVYSEVPMAIKEEDIEKIVAAADKSKAIYLLGENYCFYSDVLYCSHLVESGKIGPSVYAESEYLHDVTYRWREGNSGDVNTPKRENWYSLFDPLMYAHSIGPAQVALGGINNPTPFTEVVSYANDLGGYEGNPICAPAKAFQVALFRTEDEAIAKCANAYVFARTRVRITIQLTGRTGTYENYKMGKAGKLHLTDGHTVNKLRQRKGQIKTINRCQKRKLFPLELDYHHGANVRISQDFYKSIKNNIQPKLNACVGANMCMAGIAASKSARQNGSSIKIKNYLK